MKILLKTILAILLAYGSFAYVYTPISIYYKSEKKVNHEFKTDYAFNKRGKDLIEVEQPMVYTSSTLEGVDFPEITLDLSEALQKHKKLLSLRVQKSHQLVGNLNLSVCELEEVIDALLDHDDPNNLHKELEVFRVGGVQNSGEIKFTGYYTPLIDVCKKKTSKYKFPIYKKPYFFIGKLPTRQAIDRDNILEGQDLVLAYAKDILDIYFMQLQGSGYVKYRDGSQEMFSYGGSNGHPYRSIGRYLKNNDYKISKISQKGIREFFQKNPALLEEVLYENPSYTFFKPRQSPPKGAGHVPLTDGISVAVDRRYIPLGATLLAAIPSYNEDGKLNGHELKILLAQDVGGAIKGSGHIDIYNGIGDSAEKIASQYYHHGKMWLLLPKYHGESTDRLVLAN